VQPVNTAHPIILQKTANKPAVSVIIEDWQLAGKYKRRPISQEEIDFINVTSFYYTEYYLCNNIFIFFTERRPTVIYLQGISFYCCILEY
jgi:hypothetical protein